MPLGKRGDRQTKAGAVVTPRRRRIDLRELPEDQIVMLGCDSDARVPDFHLDVVGFAVTRRCDEEPHPAARGGEGDGIAEQVADDVRDLLAIGDQ